MFVLRFLQVLHFAFIAFTTTLILCIITGLVTMLNFYLMYFAGLIWKLCYSLYTACILFFSSKSHISNNETFVM